MDQPVSSAPPYFHLSSSKMFLFSSLYGICLPKEGLILCPLISHHHIPSFVNAGIILLFLRMTAKTLKKMLHQTTLLLQMPVLMKHKLED